MPFLETPAPFRLRDLLSSAADAFDLRGNLPLSPSSQDHQTPLLLAVSNATMDVLAKRPPHSSHPDFLHLAGLVCEAVLEVVFVALPGFLVAYTGMFDANSQRFVAELNTIVFTPCLIFTKLASQLKADKLAELAVIPVIFLVQTLVSWLAAQLMSRLWGFGRKKRQKNFILAMGVFGNSNSLPISLVISLSKTISGLHWDKIPGDNDDEVAARGILYLLIFQQLGQLLRWTWGYSVLLKPASAYDEEERRAAAHSDAAIEDGPYRDEPGLGDDDEEDEEGEDAHKPGGSGFSSSPSSILTGPDEPDEPLIGATPAQGNNIVTEPQHLQNSKPVTQSNGHLERTPTSTTQITTFPDFSTLTSSRSSPEQQRWKQPFYTARDRLKILSARCASATSTRLSRLFRALPPRLQKVLAGIWYYLAAFMRGVWRQMNPPLWAMLAALIVASVPALQHLFFARGSFVNNSITRAVSQTGGVAVPLILVVLGANLARSTLPQDQLATTPGEKREERKLLYASLLSRMVIPTVVMAPVLALTAKFVPVSILDDPIFVIVCFLLTGAPSALQLAQICQMNNVFMGALSSLLVASYVVAILPSTLILVMLALEVVEWAAA